MILSDKVSEMIKDLTVKAQIRQLALENAHERIKELKAEIYELRKRLEA
jgi:ribosomal protein L29